MNDKVAAPVYANIILFREESTPYDFMVNALKVVLGKSEHESREIASRANWLGRCVCGSYPQAVAESMVESCARLATAAGQKLHVEVEPLLPQDMQQVPRCVICDKKEADVRYLYSGAKGYICDSCLMNGARHLAAGMPSQRFRYIYELLDWHFPECRPEDLVTTKREFPERMRPDLQKTVEEIFSKAVKVVGIHGGGGYEQMTMTALMERERSNTKMLGPLQYQEVDIGEDRPVRCLKNALWLLEKNGARYAVLLSHVSGDFGQQRGVNVEVCGPSGEATVGIANRCLSMLEKAVSTSASYRGKVLSLEGGSPYTGMVGQLAVHRLPTVSREDVILPEKTLALLDKNVVQFAAKSAALKAMGQSTKKGLLLYGPPGTGKTHTIRYLAGCLPKHTTLLVTAEQIWNIGEYFTLARLLQPSIMVIEDVDLIARHREDMHNPAQELLLNKLLNELDGLRPDAEIFFLLTTNRPDALEEALASRPGRVDQAVEFPMPDEDGRRKLVSLYAGGMKVDSEISKHLVDKTQGVSAAFIKELMRRIAQYNVERKGGGKVSMDDCSAAIDDMLFTGGRLSRALLGGTTQN